MIRARPENNDVQDDSINIAGWVFADLLLSLAIIFLVSISFSVPERSGNSLSSEIQIAGQNELRRSEDRLLSIKDSTFIIRNLTKLNCNQICVIFF